MIHPLSRSSWDTPRPSAGGAARVLLSIGLADVDERAPGGSAVDERAGRTPGVHTGGGHLPADTARGFIDRAAVGEGMR
jgi:hypothetical protein